MNNIRVGIDLWNGYIKGIIINNEDDRDIILAKKTVKTEWYRKGKILDADLLAQTIHSIIEDFQKKIGDDYIDDVVVGVSHPDLIITRVSEHKRILGKSTIHHNDINHLSKLIGDISQKNNYEIVKIIPAYWLLDDERMVKNPEGSEAKKLTLIADIFYLPRVFYQHLYDIFHSLNLNVIDIIPNVLSSSDYLLDIDHKDLWSVLIDIGANQTSFAVFEEGIPLLYHTLAVGWDYVTKDISIGMQVNIKQAEKLKTEYENLSNTKENIRLDHKFLHEIISARYEQIFEKINEKLEDLQKAGKLAGGVHLTWQASKRPETIHYAREIFKLAVFPAKWHEKHHELSQDLCYQNTLALYERAQKYHNRKRGLFSFRWMRKSHSSWWWSLWESIKNFFNELF